MRNKIFLLFLISIFLFSCSSQKENIRINYKEQDRKALEIMQVAQEHHKKKQYFRARRKYNKLIDEYPKCNYADDAQLYIARTFHENDSIWRAIEEYEKLFTSYPSSDKIPEAAQYLYEIGENYWIKDKKFDAVDVFKKVQESYPFGKFSADIQFRIANYYFEEKEYSDSIIHFEKLLRLYPDNPLKEISEYKLGISYANASLHWALDQDNTIKAIQQLNKFNKLYPDNLNNYEAKKNITICKNNLAKRQYNTGKFYQNYDNNNAARIYYKKVLEDYSETDFASYAQFGIAESFYDEKNWEKALKEYKKFIDNYKESNLNEKAVKMIDEIKTKL